MIGFLTVLAALFAAPFVWERLRPDLGEAERAATPGAFADLSDGATHYRWYGPASGPIAVCVHGLTTPSVAWERLAGQLAAGGVRVLTYDLYGRGLSGRPSGAQDRGFFLRQLRELLSDQGLDGDLTLIGYSMGGSIAAAFAAAESARVRRLILIAPTGFDHAPAPWMDWARRVPVLGDWLMLGAGAFLLSRAGAAQDAPDEVRVQADETRERGYLPAVLSSLRHMLAEDMAADHRRIVEAKVPVLAIWGTADTTIPLSAMGQLARTNPTARHAQIEGAGHGLVFTHAPDVVSAIREALKSG